MEGWLSMGIIKPPVLVLVYCMQYIEWVRVYWCTIAAVTDVGHCAIYLNLLFSAVFHCRTILFPAGQSSRVCPRLPQLPTTPCNFQQLLYCHCCRRQPTAFATVAVRYAPQLHFSCGFGWIECECCKWSCDAETSSWFVHNIDIIIILLVYHTFCRLLFQN